MPKTLPPKAVLSLDGEKNQITITTGTAQEAEHVFAWLVSEKGKASDPTGSLIGLTGSVCSKGGVQKIGGVSQMVVGGQVRGNVTDQGEDWFEVQTVNEKTFRFDADSLEQVDGPRWFDFD